jgi:hypothetical protein
LDCDCSDPFQSAYKQECNFFVASRGKESVPQRNVAGSFRRSCLREAITDEERIVLEPVQFLPEYLMYLSAEEFGLAQVSFV